MRAAPAPGAGQATVFVVDDDASVRLALTRLIGSAGYAVQAFGSAAEFLNNNYQTAGPACVVLDVRMPGLTGPELQQELGRLHAILPVIFLTGHGELTTGVQAMKAGAIDFLTKPVDSEDLLDAIRSALSRADHQREEKAEQDVIRERMRTLTPREREVLDFLVVGMLNKQIAGELGIVEKTVKVHRAQVMRKMKVQSLAELVQLVVRSGYPYTELRAAPEAEEGEQTAGADAG